MPAQIWHYAGSLALPYINRVAVFENRLVSLFYSTLDCAGALSLFHFLFQNILTLNEPVYLVPFVTIHFVWEFLICGVNMEEADDVCKG